MTARDRDLILAALHDLKVEIAQLRAEVRAQRLHTHAELIEECENVRRRTLDAIDVVKGGTEDG